MEVFDYIVVGAGSAGAVLANRLSADPANRVLVIEAGGMDRTHGLMAMPLACREMFYAPALNWPLSTDAEPGADGRTLNPAAGKVLGGGSSINGMMYTRGHRRDYDQWAQMGCKGWSFADVLPYFRRAESNWRGASEIHGGDGPLSTSRPLFDPLFPKIAETARALGYPVTDDFERDGPDGFGLPDTTTHNGRRASTAQRYLRPALSRSNLKLVCNAVTTRILFENRRAIGIEYHKDGALRRAEVRGEVILSAGAYHSPKLLMLSGIGPAEELQTLGVETIHDLVGVGRNLQEHPGYTLTWRTRDHMAADAQLRLDRLTLSVLRWQLTGGGSVSGLPLAATAFIRTRRELERPDVELLFTPAALEARIWFPGWRKPVGKTLGVSAFIMRPESRGSVRLRSKDPFDSPRIKLNLLDDPEDLQTLLNATRIARHFMATEPAASIVSEELKPGAAAEDDAAVAAYIRQTVRTMQHATSTCTMGMGSASVVDPQLRVHGIDRLRVVDASIMPIVVGGHTNAPTIMIAEKGADLILERAQPRRLSAAA